MIAKVFKKKREVQMTLTAEEVATLSGFKSVEEMMLKFPTNGMEGAIRNTFRYPIAAGLKLDWQKMP